MLKRIRLEVETGSPEQAMRELDRYEHALQTAEAERYSLGSQEDWQLFPWATDNDWRPRHDAELGREVTEEVIELESPGTYRGRRVVRYSRLDTRQIEIDSGLASLQRRHWVPGWDPNPSVLRLHWLQTQNMDGGELKAALLASTESQG